MLTYPDTGLCSLQVKGHISKLCLRMGAVSQVTVYLHTGVKQCHPSVCCTNSIQGPAIISYKVSLCL